MTLTFVKERLPTARSICLTTIHCIKYWIAERLINLSDIVRRLILDAKDYLIDSFLNPDSQQISSYPNEQDAHKDTTCSRYIHNGLIVLLEATTRGSKECTSQPYFLLGLLNLQATGKECLE
jgi:hypothetical protein